LLSASTRRLGVAKQRNNFAEADLSCRLNLLERKKEESSPFLHEEKEKNNSPIRLGFPFGIN
jgi:hypothetical protein